MKDINGKTLKVGDKVVAYVDEWSKLSLSKTLYECEILGFKIGKDGKEYATIIDFGGELSVNSDNLYKIDDSISIFKK